MPNAIYFERIGASPMSSTLSGRALDIGVSMLRFLQGNTGG